jgi:hypothetical protein
MVPNHNIPRFFSMKPRLVPMYIQVSRSNRIHLLISICHSEKRPIPIYSLKPTSIHILYIPSDHETCKVENQDLHQVPTRSHNRGHLPSLHRGLTGHKIPDKKQDHPAGHIVLSWCCIASRQIAL